MSLADDLQRLEDLHQRGALTTEEFARAKARLLGGGGLPEVVPQAFPGPGVSRLRRSLQDRWIAGVCGGLARLTGTESWLWRLALAVLILFGGTGVLLYLLLWIFVPPEGGANG